MRVVIESQDILATGKAEDGYALNLLHNNPIKRAIEAEVQMARARNEAEYYPLQYSDHLESIDSVYGLKDTMTRLVTGLEEYAFLPFKDTTALGETKPTPLTLKEMEQQFAFKIAVANRVYGEEQAQLMGQEAYFKAIELMREIGMPMDSPNPQRTSGLFMPFIHRISDHQHNLPAGIDKRDESAVFNIFSSQLMRGMGGIHTPAPFQLSY